MKIRIISDLHIDVNIGYPFRLTDTDTFTVICGDIGAYFNKTSRWLNRYIKNGVFVAGNHIVYNESKHSLQYFLHQYEKHYPLDANLSFLNNSYKVIDDVVFVGGTLWTDYKVLDKNNPDLYMWYATRSLNDYRFGKINTSLCIEKERPEDLRHLHPEDCVEMFKETLSTIDKVCALFPNKKIVVVTHHAPSAKSVPLMYLNSESTPCYASSLEDFILDRPNIKLWCHGHIHTFCDYKIGDCRIICNPRGYAKYSEKSGFKKDFIIEL